MTPAPFATQRATLRRRFATASPCRACGTSDARGTASATSSTSAPIRRQRPQWRSRKRGGNHTSDAVADVRLAGVHERFGGVVAVSDVSVDVTCGTIFSLRGPARCDRTTKLRRIAGFERPDAGDVYIRGACVTALPPYRRDFSMVFQSYAPFPSDRRAEDRADRDPRRGDRKGRRARPHHTRTVTTCAGLHSRWRLQRP